MTDREALYAAVLDRPDDDTPRGVLADWLDDHGEPERAAFIRLQLERVEVEAIEHDCGSGGEWETTCPACGAAYHADDLRNREREMLIAHVERLAVPVLQSIWPSDGYTVGWDGEVDASVGLDVVGSVRFVRGLVGGVRLPHDELAGEESICTGCEEGVPDWETGVVECRRCDSTGLLQGVEGIAARLFQSHPITRVSLTDKEPYWNGGKWCFYRRLRSHPSHNVPESAVLNCDLFDAGDPGPAKSGRMAAFDSVHDAVEWLSAACVAYGRQEAAKPAPP